MRTAFLRMTGSQLDYRYGSLLLLSDGGLPLITTARTMMRESCNSICLLLSSLKHAQSNCSRSSDEDVEWTS